MTCKNNIHIESAERKSFLSLSFLIILNNYGIGAKNLHCEYSYDNSPQPLALILTLPAADRESVSWHSEFCYCTLSCLTFL